MSASILELAARRAAGGPQGITSVCSAHPLVIEAALLQARDDGADALIEATCNQVNQEGGYTGMTPADFRVFVEAIADTIGFDRSRLIFGGDHLGPNPWRHLPAEAAMEKAATMVDAYVAAGFGKLHLDTSMGCAGESEALDDRATAERAAGLAAVAERRAAISGGPRPAYVVGTEVPVPGGATHGLDNLEPTRPDAVLETIAVHRAAFERHGLMRAYDRIVGIVVQPGVEFGNDQVVAFQPERALRLSSALRSMPRLVYEAHSTDYQSAPALKALVEQGFAILKVGPGLTFALREALYGLDGIADVLDPAPERGQLSAALERLMLDQPANWLRHYRGPPDKQRMQRHFSYSDRIRYYWPLPAARAEVDRLMQRLDGRTIPAPLISQFLAPLYPLFASGAIEAAPRPLLVAAVRHALQPYGLACR